MDSNFIDVQKFMERTRRKSYKYCLFTPMCTYTDIEGQPLNN